jgi:hypothetical protein
MSIETLPPIHQSWTDEHINDLTTEELEVVYANLRRKLYQIEVQFEEHTVFYQHNKDRIFQTIEEKRQYEERKKRFISNNRIGGNNNTAYLPKKFK